MRPPQHVLPQHAHRCALPAASGSPHTCPVCGAGFLWQRHVGWLTWSGAFDVRIRAAFEADLQRRALPVWRWRDRSRLRREAEAHRAFSRSLAAL